MEHRGLLEAYRKGEFWAVQEIAESVEFYDQLFRLQEYHLTTPLPKPRK